VSAFGSIVAGAMAGAMEFTNFTNARLRDFRSAEYLLRARVVCPQIQGVLLGFAWIYLDQARR
jgi:hypothetical protein